MKLLLLVFGLSLVTGLIGQSNIPNEPCDLSECLQEKCPKISKSDCEEREKGMFVIKGDRCGCCDVCVPNNGGGEPEGSCEQATFPPAHMAEEAGTSCAPGLVYRGDEDSCEKPRLKRDLVDSEGRPFEFSLTEPEPDANRLDTQVVAKSQMVKRRIAVPRTFQVRWSACDEPKCDRGVCPPRLTRKSTCDGRFFPDQHCKCCGQCSSLLGNNADALARNFDDERAQPRNQAGTNQYLKPDNLTCIPPATHCYQYEQCNRTQMHRKDASKCDGFLESIEKTFCHCCGICFPYGKLYDECATIGEDGNPVELFPGCSQQKSLNLTCVKSPVDEKFICWEPCPNVEECLKFKCPKDQQKQSDCGKNTIFKTAAFCACCGICQPQLARGQKCLDQGKPIEPGCQEYLECKNGVCMKLDNWRGDAFKLQEELMQRNPMEWTSPSFPQIDNSGFFYPVQCKAYKCYCVSPDGNELGYVMPRFYAFNMVCDCAREKYYGKDKLKCDHLGNYQDLDDAEVPKLEKTSE